MLLRTHSFKHIFVISTLLFISGGCKNYSVKDDHPEYFTNVLKKVDTTKNGQKDKALAYLDSAYAVFPNPGIGDLYARDSIKKDIYGYVKHDYWKAMQYADTMIALVKDRQQEELFAKRYAVALILKGDCYSHLKRYDEAFHYFTLAKKVIISKVKDKCSMAEYGGNTANLLFAQHKYVLAAAYYYQHYLEQLSCSHDTHKNLMELQASLSNTGVSYERAGMYDSAMHYYNLALKTVQANEQKFPADYYSSNNAKGVIYGNQAEVFDKIENRAEAQALYEKSIEATRSADVDYTQSAQVRLARLYLKNNDVKQSARLLDEIKASIDTVYSELNLIRWYKVKSEYYKHEGNTALAFDYQEKYINLKDSVEERDKKFTDLDVSREFENMEQKAINESLVKENQQKTNYLLIAIVVSIMFVAIILLVSYNLKRSAKLNREIQQKNEDLQKAFTSLEQSHSENARIMRIVAHDLKNPVSAIHNLVYALLKKDHPQSLKEILEVIRTACINSMTLIKDLLNKKQELTIIQNEPVDLSKLLQYCVELLQAKADEKNQQLKLQLEPVNIVINRQKIWRVISNIVNNAIKFSPENAVIDIRLQKKEQSVLLSVEDKGIGIPDELKSRLFSIAPEEARIGTAGEESYGLGLSISQKIIEEHNGRIWFDSNAGEGSVFYVELPNMN